jgi:type IV pilus assembly protein PilY1
VSDNSYKVVIFVGAGYDNNEDLRFGDTQTFPDAEGVDINLAGTGGEVDGSDDPQTSAGELSADDRFAPRGRGILAIEVATMSRADSASPYTAQLTNEPQIFWSHTFEDNDQIKYPIAGNIKVVDLNADRFSDVIYVGDTGGNLWKFDISNTDKNQWTGQLLFKSNPGADSTNGRKIFYAPEVVYVNRGAYIYFGMGDREHPYNRAVIDRLYCVIDWGNKGTYPVTESALYDATQNDLQNPSTTQEEADAIREIMKSTPTSPYMENDVTKFTYGWYVKLDGTDRTGNVNILDRGEKVVASPRVISGKVYFDTYQMSTDERTGCEAGNMGISRRYIMDYLSAEAAGNYSVEDGETPSRSTATGLGMSPGVTIIVDKEGNRYIVNAPSIDRPPQSADDENDELKEEPATEETDEGSKKTFPIYWMQW